MKTFLQYMLCPDGQEVWNESDMGMGTRAESPSGPGLVVSFYGTHRFQTQPLFIPAEDFPICAEEVCKRCARHLTESLRHFYPGNKSIIGPARLPVFGLYGADHGQQRWLTEYHVFEKSGSPGQESFFFRIKVRFSKDNLTFHHGIISDYLYLQVADDFRNGRLWSHFDADIKDVSSLSRNIVLELIASGAYGLSIPDKSKILTEELKKIVKLQNLKSKIKLVCFWRNVPKSMPPALQDEFRLDPLMRYLMFKHLKKGLAELFELWKTSNLSAMRQQFLEDIFNVFAKNYGLEHYSAWKVLPDKRQEVDIIIRPYAVGCRPGLHFAEMHVCSLHEITNIRMIESESGAKTRQVLLTRSNMSPLCLEFKTREAAESFVSVLESYCHLQVNYYESLSTQQACVPSVDIIKKLHSFGPLSNDEATEKLEQSGAKEGHASATFYLIYQDCDKFDKWHVLGSSSTNSYEDTTEFKLKITEESGVTEFKLKKKNGFCAVYNSATELRIFLSRELGKQIYPSDEPCGAMALLKDEGEIEPYNYSDGPQLKHSQDQPMLFEEKMIPVQENQLLAHGHFSNVYRSKAECLGEEVVIKKIKEDLKFQDSFRKGVAHLHELRKVTHCFVRCYGQMLASPVRWVLESIPLGNLQDRMRSGNSLNWLQIPSILHQLGNCLYELKKCKQTYRSFCSQKILIFKECPEKLLIRLGDPGSAFFMDTLNLRDQLNMQRLPWIAVERFSNLQDHTIESEMYAIGTTIWEILWNGADPNEKIPSRFSPEKFFREGQRLPSPYVTLQSMGDLPEEQQPKQTFVSQWVVSHSERFLETSPNSQGTSADDAASISQISPVVPPAADSGNSQLEGAEMQMTFLSAAENATPCNSEELLRNIMQKMVEFMTCCWSPEPHERPKPNDMLMLSTDVIRMAEKIMSCDQRWQITLLHQVLQDTGKITNKDAAQRLVQTLAANDDQGKEIYQELLNECAADMFIMSSRLEPDEQQNILGEGHFGKVCCARLVEAATKKLSQEERARLKREKVAVKYMQGASVTDQRLFVREVINSIHLKHDNIVTYLGLVIPDGNQPMKLVMEYVAGGTVEKFVKTNKSKLGELSLKLKLKKIAVNIASGMRYLNQEKMVHGDLAARNILLSHGPDNELIGKVSDFGLAHKLQRDSHGQYLYSLSNSRTHHNIDLPVYWMALELLEEKNFTNKTDVWSFGTVLWEMYSGEDPVKMGEKGLKGNEIVEDLKKKYRNKLRLPAELHTPRSLYNIMKKCWSVDPDDRPAFSELEGSIEDLNECDLETEALGGR